VFCVWVGSFTEGALLKGGKTANGVRASTQMTGYMSEVAIERSI